jgi:hypothetical protein
LSDPNEFTETHQRLLERALDPELLRLGSAIREIAGFDIPASRRGPFERFHSFVSDPVPSYISALRANEQSERKWYPRHVSGILDDVRGGLAAAEYHLRRLADLEEAVIDILAGSDFAERMGNSAMAFGGTRKMDIE